MSKSIQILKDFFRSKGWIAGLHENYVEYVHMMADLIDGRVRGPACTPNDCIITNNTYEYDIVVGGVVMCTIPAMTDSGYFIIKGSEKVIVIQEVRLKTEVFTALNSPTLLTSQTTPSVVCRRVVVGSAVESAGVAICELFIEKAYVPTRISMVDNSVIELDTHMIHNNMRGIKSVGIFELLFHIFGDSVEHVSYLTRSYCAEDVSDGRSAADACITYIMSSMRGTGGLAPVEDGETIRSKMFGGMSVDAAVATLVTMIVACVKVHLKLALPSDRDDYVMKCLRTPGETVYRMFRQCVALCKKPGNLKSSIENHVHNFIKRGDATIGGRTYSKMAIQLSKRSDIDVLSCVRKVMMPCDENSPNIQMRQIHASQRGFICPCETPEGKTVGITKSLACCCMISTKTNMSSWISDNCTRDISPGCWWVIVDGAATGWCEQTDIELLKDLYPTVSFTVKYNVLNIRAAASRPIRPLLKIDGHPIDWNNPKIVYLDPAECAVAKIASLNYSGDWRSFTHMEVHPCTMLGLAASLIPFPEHNQSARNVFSSSMIKQAMQMDTQRDKACYTLQKPVVYTAIGREVGYDDSPNGLNLVVCIMSVSGFNQEDAIIVKKSSVERGMFMSVVKHTNSVIVDNPWDIVCNDDGVSIVHGNTERSIAEVNHMLSSPKIHSISTSAAEGGRSKVHVTFQEDRYLNLGDKLSSRHGQKGVIGTLMREEDMPFNKDGITPDIIINPHAIPSRMTVGQLIESALGKAAVIKGDFVDGTPFVQRDASEVGNNTETMILGATGEMIETPVAMGIVYYMALKHQAVDKMYARSSGPKSIMSRQPISGRSKGGGLRFGEMEYDCLVAHGTSKMITEVSETSDIVDAPYCEKCKIITDVFDSLCRLCNTPTVRRRVPFSYVVFKDMMLAANMQVQTELPPT